MSNKLIPYRSDDDIKRMVNKYDEYAFDDLPYQLRQSIINRSITFPTRKPTELEMWETNEDAREHRHMNKQLTLEDYKDKYKRGRVFNLYA